MRITKTLVTASHLNEWLGIKILLILLNTGVNSKNTPSAISTAQRQNNPDVTMEPIDVFGPCTTQNSNGASRNQTI